MWTTAPYRPAPDRRSDSCGTLFGGFRCARGGERARRREDYLRVALRAGEAREQSPSPALGFPARYNHRCGEDRREPRPRIGPSQFAVLARHAGVARLKLVEHRIGIMRSPGPNVGQATFDGGVNGRQAAFAFLHEPQGIAHDFARIIITHTGKLGLNERLEMLPLCVAAWHSI